MSLDEQAEKLFPYPDKACKWVKIKIDWKRDRWKKTATISRLQR